jgi:hypothetical protein
VRITRACAEHRQVIENLLLRSHIATYSDRTEGLIVSGALDPPEDRAKLEYGCCDPLHGGHASERRAEDVYQRVLKPCRV